MKRCQRHQTKVASHTETPLGVSKWLGKRHHIPGTLPLGKGQGPLMSPTQGQAYIIGEATPYQPFRSPYGGSCMAGYHCLMPTAFLLVRHNTNLISDGISFRCNTTLNLSPFRGSVNGYVLSRGSVLRTSPPACILSCLWHYFIWNANGIDMKIPDKNLSGKSDEREVKLCKNRFFALHSIFFILRKLRFHIAKGMLWLRQRPCFIASNITFHTTKPYLWRNKT